MVNTVTAQTINDGARNLVIKTHIVGDGSGEESDTSLIDISGFNGTFDDVKIMRLQATFRGFSADLHWDATTNVDIKTLPAEEDHDFCYRQYGGLINNAGTGKTGDILFSTTGLGAGDEGTIILTMKKRGG